MALLQPQLRCLLVMTLVWWTSGCGSFKAANAAELPLLDVGGFTWAENLVFDLYPGRSELFVSDAVIGGIWRIVLTPSGQKYEREMIVGGAEIKGINGLAMNEDSTVLFANAKLTDGNRTVVLAVNPVDGSWKILSKLAHMGNGLAYDYRTGYLYMPYEGDEIPALGAVYVVDTLGVYPTSIVVSHLESADGCRISFNTNTLYISNVIEGRLNLFSLPTDRSAPPQLTFLRSFKAPGMKMLDDFALDDTLNLIWGADFLAGNVVRFNADGSGNGTVVVSGLLNPTSVQIGAGSDFNSTSIYITEGGGLVPIERNRRVLESRGQVPLS